MPSEDVTVPEENEGQRKQTLRKRSRIMIRQIGLEDGYTLSFVPPA